MTKQERRRSAIDFWPSHEKDLFGWNYDYLPLSPLSPPSLSIHAVSIYLSDVSQSLGLNKACDVLSLSSISGCQHGREYVSKFLQLRNSVFIL